jgi:cellulose synthase/poly-beta-1,6-N-acetylglucosamine synthase-like glycosyltransferase
LGGIQKQTKKKEKRKKRYPKIHTIVCVEKRERERWMVGWLVVVSYSFCFVDCSPFVSFSFILLFLLLFFFFFFFLTYPIAGSVGSVATLWI